MTQGGNTLVAVIFTVLIVFIAGVVLTQIQRRQDCEKRATVAAAEWYPMLEYPDTSERQRLQNQYRESYLKSCH